MTDARVNDELQLNLSAGVSVPFENQTAADGPGAPGPATLRTTMKLSFRKSWWWWLLPLVVLLLILGAIIIFGSGSVLAPLMYPFM